MKLKKTLRKQKIENPFRVPKPFTNPDTRCRIDYGFVNECMDNYKVIIDADREVTEFWKQVEKNVPYPDKFDDSILEVWYFTEKWLPKLKKWAVKYFDSVTFKDYTQEGKAVKLK